MNTEKVYEFTKQGLEEAKEKLEILKVKTRKEVTEKIKEARSFGDLSENAEYDAAKKEQAELEERIAKIEQFSSAAYEMYAGYDDGTSIHAVADEEIFKQFILSVIEFFKTGKLIAEHKQTLMVMALMDAAKIAIHRPFEWINITSI